MQSYMNSGDTADASTAAYQFLSDGSYSGITVNGDGSITATDTLSGSKWSSVSVDIGANWGIGQVTFADTSSHPATITYNSDGSTTFQFNGGSPINMPVGTSASSDANDNLVFTMPNSQSVLFDPTSNSWSLFDTSAAFPDGGAMSHASFMAAAASLFDRSRIDPIVLDLSSGGTGVQLSSLNDSSAYFDLTNSGFAVHTGWVGSTTGFLVKDNNSNGSIDNITEMFGNGTTDGFTALQTLDTNHDGKITSADTGFSSLKIWTDADGDGTTDSGELKTLAQLNISEIDLNSSEVNQEVNGNLIGSVATFKRTDNSTGQVAEAFFDNSQMDSTFTGSYDLNPLVVLLPNLRGYGTVPDLYIGMSMDSTLMGMVQDLASTSLDDAGTLSSQIKDILYRWAGVDSVDPISRGQYVNAKDLTALETFVGEAFVSDGGSSNPQSVHQGQNLESAWHNLVTEMTSRLLVQGPLASLFPGIGYDFDSDSFTGTSLTASATAIVSGLPTDAIDKLQYVNTTLAVINDVAADLGISQGTYISTLEAAYTGTDMSAAASEIAGSVPSGTVNALRYLASFIPLMNDLADSLGIAKSSYDTTLQSAFSTLEHFSIRLGVSRVREISVAFFFGNTFEK
jgi:hypothetical protein